ncbi:MAG: tRNA pseudouridine(38-40) synthase TruA [SAR202 cluster bacterium Casp-Chloro-G4]|nr:tRNA pseudouridine(38-40) synthase TruA [Chloroflexota bacterium]MDA1228291.1 tRNA pseudouridine(38-40) synthase TruA [Chloroflexota bacterium]PKB61413.1 MAG: tRNA pseudouridine(38-40) synthase TruA [SAR202 cluster bacterium Casp-Chloro-G4]
MQIEYEGTAYAGFQYQVNAPSIQEELEKAITALTGETIRIRGAGRTDAGVHAQGQVIAFDTESRFGPDEFVVAMNYHLPDDIAVRAAYIVDDEFDPRRNARARSYRYTVLRRSVPSPLLRRQTCLVPGALDLPLMESAVKMYEGEHDFKRFAGPLEHREASTVRFVYESSVSQSGDLLMIDVKGNAFLPHQVRRMVGALVDVGRGKISLNEFKLMIDGDETEAVAHSMPAHGLSLVSVKYDDYPPILS